MQRLLLADDEDELRRVLATVLTKRRPALEVREVDNGNDAVALLASFRPTVLVTDLHMPGTCGIRLILRACSHDASVRVILMTATPGDLPLDRAGRILYLEKPFPLARFSDAVEQLLEDAAPITALTLRDVSSLYRFARSTGAVVMTQTDTRQEGTAWFELGELLHAQTGALEGENARDELMRWSAVCFEPREERAPRRTIASRSSASSPPDSSPHPR